MYLQQWTVVDKIFFMFSKNDFYWALDNKFNEG